MNSCFPQTQNHNCVERWGHKGPWDGTQFLIFHVLSDVPSSAFLFCVALGLNCSLVVHFPWTCKCPFRLQKLLKMLISDFYLQLVKSC